MAVNQWMLFVFLSVQHETLKLNLFLNALLSSIMEVHCNVMVTLTAIIKGEIFHRVFTDVISLQSIKVCVCAGEMDPSAPLQHLGGKETQCFLDMFILKFGIRLIDASFITAVII